MMKEPLISVLVPIYKIDRYLGICIESIINQTYRNLEIILVDDGSPDRCPEICDLYAKKDSRIKVIHKTNGGLVSARKAGILASTGDYIGYIDGDDWIGRGFYQSLVNSMLESEADIAIAGFSRDLFDSSALILNTIPSGLYEGENLKDIYKQLISYGRFFRHGITTYLWNKLFKREVVFKYQLSVPDDITIGEDAAVTYPAILEAKRICITDNCAYHYRQREDSMLKSSGNFCDESRRLKSLYNFMYESVKSLPKEYKINQQIDDLIVGTYIIRSGGYLDAENNIFSTFPFSADIKGKNVVVYGAGTFGQQLVKRLKLTNVCNVVSWIDDDYWEYRRCCMDVDPISSISNIKFDYILIANLDHDLADVIAKQILNYGVSMKNILTIDTTLDERTNALKVYLEK